MDIKVVGVNGSPRPKGYTETAIDEALDAAKTIEGVTTEKINLYSYRIGPCTGCFKCYFPIKELKFPDHLCQTRTTDDGDKVLKKLYEADGLIVASPTYYGNVSAQIKTLFDRSQPIHHPSRQVWRLGVGNCVGGAIACIANRNGGAETTLEAIHNWMFVQHMIVVGTQPSMVMDLAKGKIASVSGQCYYGGVVVGLTLDQIRSTREMSIEQQIKNIAKVPSREDILKYDPVGFATVRGLARRVTSVAKVVHSASPRRLRLKLTDEERIKSPWGL